MSDLASDFNFYYFNFNTSIFYDVFQNTGTGILLLEQNWVLAIYDQSQAAT